MVPVTPDSHSPSDSPSRPDIPMHGVSRRFVGRGIGVCCMLTDRINQGKAEYGGISVTNSFSQHWAYPWSCYLHSLYYAYDIYLPNIT